MKGYMLILGIWMISIVNASTFIAEGGKGWDLNIISDEKKEVITTQFEYNESIIELTIDNHPNSTTKGGYKWHMALCPNEQGLLRIQYEDTEGGYEFATWIDAVWGNMVDYGLPETWCNGTGYILFNSGSKNSLPRGIRLMPINITNFTLNAGTSTAQLIGSGLSVAGSGTGKNRCTTSDGIEHVAFEGSDDDLWYGNNSNDWNSIEVFAGTFQHIAIVCNETQVYIFYSEGDFINYTKSSDYINWDSEEIALWERAGSGLDRPDCQLDENKNIWCTARSSYVWDHIIVANSTSWNSEINLPNQSSLQDGDHGNIEISPENDVYIIIAGDVVDQIWIYSTKDNFATKHNVASGLGNVRAGTNFGVAGLSISEDCKIGYTIPLGADAHFLNSTCDNWNGTWTAQELDTQESRSSDGAYTEVGEYHIIHQDDSTGNSDLLRSNTSDNGKTWESRTIINTNPAFSPSIQDSVWGYNKPSNLIKYSFSNSTGFWIDEYGITSPDTCTYSGGALWTINPEDYCNISITTGSSSLEINITGSFGYVNITDTGNLSFTSMMWYNKTAWDFYWNKGGQMWWF